MDMTSTQETKTLLDFFPMEKPREKQAKSLRFIEEAVRRGFKHIVLEAPTGFGKSGVGVAACSWQHGYYLVTQKLLQDQLAQDFVHPPHDVAILKNAAEYPCPAFKNCAMGKASKKCREKSCAYEAARELFKASPRAVTNYPFFLTAKSFGKMEERPLAVLDETHGLERQIIRFVDLTISEDTLERWECGLTKVPQLQGISDYVRWVKEKYVPEVQAHYQMLCQLFEGEGSSDKEAKRIFEVETHLNQVKRAISEIQADPRGWVYWQELDTKQKLLSIARPIHAAPFAESVIFDVTDIHVHMSAFPGEKNVYCRSLGLDPDQVAWASFGSTFPIDNRPNVMCSLGSMSMRNVDANLPVALRFIERVLDKHGDEKGLIHTHSYKLGQALVKHFQSTKYWPRFIFPAAGEERDEAYARHKTGNEPTVLVSPSMTEGFDFPDDSARFQVICKCPYPSLGDLQVRAKKDDDPLWYKLETIKTIVQAAGRICRSEEDYGVTYMLDSDIDRLFNDCGAYLPGWFSNAMVWPQK